MIWNKRAYLVLAIWLGVSLTGPAAWAQEAAQDASPQEPASVVSPQEPAPVDPPQESTPSTPLPKPAQDESLTDLIYMGVSVASKKVENIHKAPGVVSVITSEDIANLPAETLYDVLKTVADVTITESFFGYTDISFRGIKETHYNNRTLLLLNGTPVRDVVVGTHWLEAIPADVIERIEIIRGPGSVLYGTGAFAGVISVITKQQAPTVKAAFTGGSKTMMQGDLTVAQQTEDMGFLLGGSYHDSKGYNAEAMDETGVTAQMGSYPKDPDAYEDDFYNIFGNFNYTDFDLDLFHFREEKDKFGITPVHLTTGEVVITASGAAVRFETDLQPLHLSSRIHYAENKYDGYLDTFPPVVGVGTPIEMTYSGQKYGLDLDGRMEVMEDLAVELGLYYEGQKSYPYQFTNLQTGAVSPYSTYLREYFTDDLSFYAQVDVAALSSLRVVGGVRYNHNRDYGDTTVPRGSLIYTALENLFIKLLYGQAFRNPTFFEKYVNTQNVLYGDPDLKPEWIETLELSTDWVANEDHAVRLTLFTLSTNDMINRAVNWRAGDVPPVTLLEDRGVSTTPTRNTPGYANTKGQQINGVELEMKGKLVDELLGYTVNASYKEGKEKADWSPVQFLDQIVGNLIFTNKIDRFINTLGLEVVGPRKGNIDSGVAAPGFTRGQEVTVPSYALLNLKSTYEVMDNLNLSLIAKNLLGQKVLYPEYIRRRIDVVPGDSGVNVFGQLSYQY
jgi:outer membrane receptor for ferrienterochelin and colicins